MTGVSRRQFVTVAGAALAGIRPRRAALLEVLVLGSVQDGGLPQAGCYSPRCERARRAARPRYIASLALIEPDAERFYLVDASPDLGRQMDLIPSGAFRRRVQRRQPFDGIFLTHAHIGHYLGLALLGREGLGIRPTPCYCTEQMAGFLTTNAPWSLLVTEGRLVLRPLALRRWHRISDALEVRLLPVPHRDEFSDTVGFIFRGPRRSLLYVPDTDGWERWPEPIETVVESADVGLLDGTFYSAGEVPGRAQSEIPHPLIPDTMARLGPLARGGKEIVFTHLNNTNPVLDDGGPESEVVRGAGFSVAREGDLHPL